MQNYNIEPWARMTDRMFRLLEFIQGFISDREVVALREILSNLSSLERLEGSEQICKAR